jgi:AcrR family transcriptional regulator
MTASSTLRDAGAESRKRNRPAMEAMLIEGATALFAERGYDATTTRAIGDRVGCSEALIQNYFGGKEGLLLAVMQSGSEWEEYRAFFRRPLCGSIEQEAIEHLNYVAKGLVARTPYLRILMSRALVDPSFRARFGELTLRTLIVSEVAARLERCRQADMLGDAGSIPSTAEWLVDMGFLLGFVHPQLDGYDAAQITSMTRDFAHFFARAVQFSKEDNN